MTLSVLLVLIGLSAGLTFDRVADWLDKLHFGLAFVFTALAGAEAAHKNNTDAAHCAAQVFNGIRASGSCPPIASEPTLSFGEWVGDSLKEFPFVIVGLVAGIAIRFVVNKLRTSNGEGTSGGVSPPPDPAAPKG